MRWLVVALLMVGTLAGCSSSAASRIPATPTTLGPTGSNIGTIKTLLGTSSENVFNRLGPPTQKRMNELGQQDGEPPRESWDVERDGNTYTVTFQDDRVYQLMFGIADSQSPDTALRALGLSTGKKPTTDTPGVLRWENLDGYYVQLVRDPRSRQIHSVVLRKA